jgi:hypothetical protein
LAFGGLDATHLALDVTMEKARVGWGSNVDGRRLDMTF